MATTSPELTPHALAALWKKQGGFDSLRKQLLTDFLASPERDALLSRLDALLPTLLSHPPVSRQARKDRPASALAELDRRLALKEWSDKLDVQLRTTEKGKGGKGGKRVGRRVEKELARTLRTARGQKVEEEESSEEEEEFEEEVVVNGGNLPTDTSTTAPLPSTETRANPATPSASLLPPPLATTEAASPPTPPPAQESAPIEVDVVDSTPAVDAASKTEPEGEAKGAMEVETAVKAEAEDVEMAEVVAGAVEEVKEEVVGV